MSAPVTERDLWRAAIDMLNEMHERMGFEMVYRIKLERLAVDKIAQKHIAKAFETGVQASSAKITRLEGEATVLRELLLDCTSVIAEIEPESSAEADMLDDLHSKIIKALTGAPA